MGAAFGVVLGALYMLTVVEKMFFGPVTKPENKHLPDMNGRELVAVAPLIVMIFVIGLFPNIFLSTMRDAVSRVQGDFSSRIEKHPAPLYYDGPMRLEPRSAEATKTASASAPAEGAAKADEKAGAKPEAKPDGHGHAPGAH